MLSEAEIVTIVTFFCLSGLFYCFAVYFMKGHNLDLKEEFKKSFHKVTKIGNISIPSLDDIKSLIKPKFE